eukprot:239392-Rhodomonas_salina.3
MHDVAPPGGPVSSHAASGLGISERAEQIGEKHAELIGLVLCSPAAYCPSAVHSWQKVLPTLDWNVPTGHDAHVDSLAAE